MSLPELTAEWHRRHKEIQQQQEQEKQLKLQHEQEQRQIQQQQLQARQLIEQCQQQQLPIGRQPIRSIDSCEMHDLKQQLKIKQYKLDEVMAISGQTGAAKVKLQIIFETIKLK